MVNYCYYHLPYLALSEDTDSFSRGSQTHSLKLYARINLGEEFTPNIPTLSFQNLPFPLFSVSEHLQASGSVAPLFLSPALSPASASVPGSSLQRFFDALGFAAHCKWRGA